MHMASQCGVGETSKPIREGLGRPVGSPEFPKLCLITNNYASAPLQGYWLVLVGPNDSDLSTERIEF